MKKFTVLFFFIAFLIGTDTFLIAPLLPTLSEFYHIPLSISGWLVSAYALGYACFALISGPFSDGRDRRKIMFGGLLAFSLSSFLCGLSSSFAMMLVFRFLSGISASFVSPQVWASIPVLIKKEHVVRITGYVASGFAVSQLIGIPAGSYLAAVSWRVPFFFCSAWALLLAVFILFLLPKLSAGRQGHLSLRLVYSGIFHNKWALRFLLAYFFFEMGIFYLTQFTGTWLSTGYGLTVVGIGTTMLLLGGSNLTGTLMSHRILKRLGFKRAFILEIIVIALLYAILPFTSRLHASLILLALNFFVNGLLFPLLQVLMQWSAPQTRSTISAFSSSVMYLGTTIDGIAGGLLMTRFPGFYGISFTAVVLTVISLFIFIRFPFTEPNKESEADAHVQSA